MGCENEPLESQVIPLRWECRDVSFKSSDREKSPNRPLATLPALPMIKKQLRPYQIETVQRWKSRLADGLGLFHEQRVGKTLPALAIADVERPQRLLIVTTKKGIKVWHKEIDESWDFSDWILSTQDFTQQQCDYQVINYSQVVDKRRFNRLKRWLKGAESSMMIVDEAHHIKRRGSKWSRRCRALGRYATYRLALTGTPIAQGIWDAWAIFDFLDPSIFGKWAITRTTPREGTRPLIEVTGGFQHRFLIMDPRWSTKPIGTQNENDFYELFHRHSVRKTLAEVKREAGHKATRIRRSILKAQLSEIERDHYLGLEEDLYTVVHQKRIETPLVITLSMKLQQICGGFIIDEEKNAHLLDTENGSSKLALLRQTLRTLDRKIKPLIVCRFIHELEQIDRLLREEGRSQVKRIQGGIDFDPTQAITEDAIVLQIQSGEAVDLSVSDTIIFYSLNFSHIDHEQTRFRIRQYFSSKVRYIYLAMEDTIDELILEAVQRKKRLSEVVCDHYRRPIMTEENPEALKKEMGDLSTDTPSPKEGKTMPAKKKAKKTASSEPKSAKRKSSNGSADNANVVTLAELAKDYKIEPTVARQRLRAAGLKKAGRWAWEKGSKELKAAEKALETVDAE